MSHSNLPPLPQSLQIMLAEQVSSSDYGSNIQSYILQEHGIEKTGNQVDKSGEQTTLQNDSPGTIKPNGLSPCLAELKKEMKSLREQDMNLLCQLWSLHESLQEFKLFLRDRSETNSECSSFGLDGGTETIPTIEEHEYENDMFHAHIYENEMLDCDIPVMRNGVTDEEQVYEPVYESYYVNQPSTYNQ